MGITPEGRKERYEFINRTLPRLYGFDRPVIAAINASAVGIGVILAASCDIRVASDTAFFACPEIDYGLVAGGAGLFAWLKMPEGRVREMLYTGRRFSAAELSDTGFFNYVVPRDEVVPKAMEIAELIAQKSLPAIKARKVTSNALERLSWYDALSTGTARVSFAGRGGRWPGRRPGVPRRARARVSGRLSNRLRSSVLSVLGNEDRGLGTGSRSCSGLPNLVRREILPALACVPVVPVGIFEEELGGSEKALSVCLA